jgi:hypothetical protein
LKLFPDFWVFLDEDGTVVVVERDLDVAVRCFI